MLSSSVSSSFVYESAELQESVDDVLIPAVAGSHTDRLYWLVDELLRQEYASGVVVVG